MGILNFYSKQTLIGMPVPYFNLDRDCKKLIVLLENCVLSVGTQNTWEKLIKN